MSSDLEKLRELARSEKDRLAEKDRRELQESVDKSESYAHEDLAKWIEFVDSAIRRQRQRDSSDRVVWLTYDTTPASLFGLMGNRSSWCKDWRDSYIRKERDGYNIAPHIDLTRITRNANIGIYCDALARLMGEPFTISHEYFKFFDDNYDDYVKGHGNRVVVTW